jgi:carboxylate-amine ligase
MNAGPDPISAGSRLRPENAGSWPRWNGNGQRYTLGVEEEVMLLEPRTLALAQLSDRVIPRFSPRLLPHVAPETHAAVIELMTGVHHTVDEAVAELGRLRRTLVDEIAAMGLRVAAAGTHPLASGADTEVSGGQRYRLLGDSLRGLARREPTMALHVHVGIPRCDDAIRVFNGLRQSVPLLLALSANSPFVRGRDGGFASERTVIFQAFPRTGLPRAFADYAEYVDAVEALVAPGAVPDNSFMWWDVRLRPALGTVEMRVMDAQSSAEDVRPLVALIQSIARLALEGDVPRVAGTDEVLAENRFLAARDGMGARLVDSRSRCLVAIGEILEELLGRCRPHALALGCAAQLELVPVLAAANGAERQRGFDGPLQRLMTRLVQQFLPGSELPALRARVQGPTVVSPLPSR